MAGPTGRLIHPHDFGAEYMRRASPSSLHLPQTLQTRTFQTMIHVGLVALLGSVLLSGSRIEAKDGSSATALNFSATGYAVLDPSHLSLYRINDERLMHGILECLTVIDPESGKAKPAAAESWTLAADRRTWTFHLRKNAVWSDGSPVTTEDFLRSWTRTLYSMEKSPWRYLFRPIKGCSAILDQGAKAKALSRLRSKLKTLKNQFSGKEAIPGERINSEIDNLGVRPHLRGFKSKAVRKLAKLGEGDTYSLESIDPARDALKKLSKTLKLASREAYAAFGKTQGVVAKDKYTFEITTEWYCPSLPDLLSRAAFAPLHKGYADKRSKFFQPENYVCNGPYTLAGRGAEKKNPDSDFDILSVVELTKNPKYNGPWLAKLGRVMCLTDQKYEDDHVEFSNGKLDWVPCDAREYPNVGDKKKPETNERKRIVGTKGFTTYETPTTVYLQFRCDRAPFDKKDAREAFAAAVDRAAVAKQYWPVATPATRIVPPNVFGRHDAVVGPSVNASRAKSVFSKLGFTVDTWFELKYYEGAGNAEAISHCIQHWKNLFKVIDPGSTIVSYPDIQSALRSGDYYCMLVTNRGTVNDAFAYLGGFHSKNADSGLGWYDETFDALIDGARNPDTIAADAEAYVQRIGMPELKSLVSAASGSEEAANALRTRLLGEAEKRLMSEYVIVPLVYLKEAALVGNIKGGTSPAARSNPAFPGVYLPAVAK